MAYEGEKAQILLAGKKDCGSSPTRKEIAYLIRGENAQVSLKQKNPQSEIKKWT